MQNNQENFLKEYRALCRKHGLELTAESEKLYLFPVRDNSTWNQDYLQFQTFCSKCRGYPCNEDEALYLEEYGMCEDCDPDVESKK